jgi:hypothetical protein
LFGRIKMDIDASDSGDSLPSTPGTPGSNSSERIDFRLTLDGRDVAKITKLTVQPKDSLFERLNENVQKKFIKELQGRQFILQFRDPSNPNEFVVIDDNESLEYALTFTNGKKIVVLPVNTISPQILNTMLPANPIMTTYEPMIFASSNSTPNHPYLPSADYQPTQQQFQQQQHLQNQIQHLQQLQQMQQQSQSFPSNGISGYGGLGPMQNFPGPSMQILTQDDADLNLQLKNQLQLQQFFAAQQQQQMQQFANASSSSSQDLVNSKPKMPTFQLLSEPLDGCVVKDVHHHEPDVFALELVNSVDPPISVRAVLLNCANYQIRQDGHVENGEQVLKPDTNGRMMSVFENMSIHTPGMDDCIIEFIAEKGEQVIAKYRHPIHIFLITFLFLLLLLFLISVKIL